MNKFAKNLFIGIVVMAIIAAGALPAFAHEWVIDGDQPVYGSEVSEDGRVTVWTPETNLNVGVADCVSFVRYWYDPHFTEEAAGSTIRDEWWTAPEGEFSSNLPGQGGDYILTVTHLSGRRTVLRTVYVPCEEPEVPTEEPCEEQGCVTFTPPPAQLTCQTRFGEVGRPLSVARVIAPDGRELVEGPEWNTVFNHENGNVSLSFTSGDWRETRFTLFLSDGSTKELQMQPGYGAQYNQDTPETSDDWGQNECWRVDAVQGTGSTVQVWSEAPANPDAICIPTSSEGESGS